MKTCKKNRNMLKSAVSKMASTKVQIGKRKKNEMMENVQNNIKKRTKKSK